MRSTLLLLALTLGCGSEGRKEEPPIVITRGPHPRPTASPSPTPSPTQVSESTDWFVVQRLCSLSSQVPCLSEAEIAAREDACLAYYGECLVSYDLSTCITQEGQ